MNPRLIILSDLRGGNKPKWINKYIEQLCKKFDIEYYDTCILGQIDTFNHNQEDIHNQFIKTGIDIAIKRLVELEKEKTHILAFSIGGVIAWKAGLMGLNIERLYAVSSTRLRYETQKPNDNTMVWYGNEDKNKPPFEWANKLLVNCQIIGNRNHEMYKEQEIINIICDEILQK